MLNTAERSRYSRHFNLPDFGFEHQEMLSKASVLVVGAGGLGCPVLSYLGAAGIGTLGIVDDDRVELSNLQRQVLYSTDDVGKMKVEVAAQRLHQMNPYIQIKTYPVRLSAANAQSIVTSYDIVVDGTDNFPTRYLVNDACCIMGKTNVYASIYQYEGQVSVFNAPLPEGGRSSHYRDLYPVPPEVGLVPDCASGGVLGVLAGIIGNLQALEVIKCVTGIGETLVGRMLVYDALTSTYNTLRYPKYSSIQIKEFIDYEDFCGIQKNTTDTMNTITATELQAWRESNKDHQLIDVRETKEVNFASIGGDHIVLGDILNKSDQISKDKPVVVMCRSGRRSAAAINALKQHGFDNLYNLDGGILAWSRDVDSSVPTY
ncbi:MAG: molybdopterin-synthase adenylyltransferase MoeB [Bacteroidota bacterium]